METRHDFLKCLPSDISTRLFGLLDDPGDLIRSSAVSRSWHEFVVVNGFCKKLLAKLHPEALDIVHVVDAHDTVESMKTGSSSSCEKEQLRIEHKVYAFFMHLLGSPYPSRECMLEPIAASSTDNYPDESIAYTLESDDQMNGRPSYWSSKGQKNPRVPETLTYRLKSKLCVVDQIDLRPFKAYFQYGHPIYSSQAVCFKMGYSLSPGKEPPTDDMLSGNSSAGNYIWTYVSPIYPMVQEDILQPFKLPKPVICVGGIVQIELMGRVQTQEMDGLYYICLCHVKVKGRPLSPVFDVGLLDVPGKFVLKYREDVKNRFLNGSTEYDGDESLTQHRNNLRGPGWLHFAQRAGQEGASRGWNELLITLLAEGQLDFVESDEEEPFI